MVANWGYAVKRVHGTVRHPERMTQNLFIRMMGKSFHHMWRKKRQEFWISSDRAGWSKKQAKPATFRFILCSFSFVLNLLHISVSYIMSALHFGAHLPLFFTRSSLNSVQKHLKIFWLIYFLLYLMIRSKILNIFDEYFLLLCSFHICRYSFMAITDVELFHQLFAEDKEKPKRF